MSAEIVVEPYDERWPDRFDAERVALERILQPWLAGGIHHIGSTAVPGLPAKPIIDLIAGVEDLDRARAAVGPLAGRGYVHAAHRPATLYFYRPAAADPVPGDADVHTHHLHLTEPGRDRWRERLAFRDALRADPALVGEYRDLKQRLAGEHPGDLLAYTAGKRAFVVAVLAGAGVILG